MNYTIGCPPNQPTSLKVAHLPMPKAFKPLLISALLALAPLAHAQNTDDAMDGFLADRGFLNRLASVPNEVKQRATELVMHAMGFIGIPYRLGGSSFEQGFDCSGFVQATIQQTMGLTLPRTSAEQAQATRPIAESELMPGDLVFFNTLRRAFSHVGIYVGDGRFIHSPRTGSQIRVEDMNAQYWATRFNGARRVEAAAKTTAPRAQ